MGMYDVVSPDMLRLAADPAYAGFFVQDGLFWEFLVITSYSIHYTKLYDILGHRPVLGTGAIVALFEVTYKRGTYLLNIALCDIGN